MTTRSVGSSNPSTSQQNPSGSTSSGQAIVHVKVLRMRSNDTHEYLTLKSTADGIGLSTGDLHIGHVPNVKTYWPSKSSWEQRFCIRADLASRPDDSMAPRLDKHVRGTYYVMICKLEELGRHDAVAHITDACVYGDAFFFRVSDEYVDLGDKAVFESMPAEMISLGIARRMLQEIAKGWEGGMVPGDWVNLNGPDRHGRNGPDVSDGSSV